MMAPEQNPINCLDHPRIAFELNVDIPNIPELLKAKMGHPGPHRDNTGDLVEFWFGLNFQRVCDVFSSIEKPSQKSESLFNSWEWLDAVYHPTTWLQ